MDEMKATSLSQSLAKASSWMKPHITVAEGHCDVPCGIYDPVTAQLAALSVARFLDQISELAENATLTLEQQARLARIVAEKEAHAAQVKAEITVIWGDYFKSVHLEQHPQIHELTHEILRTASSCKQEIDPNNGRQLVSLVNQFAEVFWATKGVATQTVTAPYKPGLPVVQPVLEAASA